MKRNKTLKRIAVGGLIFVLVAAGLAVVGFMFIWNSESVDKERLLAVSNPITFYDSEGGIIDNVKTKKYCEIGAVSQDCVDAFIAIEDKNFYQHSGLSYPRIVKALFNNLRAGYSKEGASTITQQLIKNTHLTNEKTVRRKLREAVLAMKLEQQYSKDEILELYLNAIYFGNNIYGIGNAAEFYFSKSPAELTAAEGAGLAGMVKSPKRYDPVTNHGNFLTRARLVLTLMHEQGYLTDEEYKTGAADEIAVTAKTDMWLGGTYQSAALAEAGRLLNLSESDIVNYGYKIETYYQPDKQRLLYNSINEPEYQIDADKFIMLSAPRGQVSALWASTPTLLTARRNFGSVIKPLLVYAPALELGVISPESKVDDSPLIDSDFNPENVDGKYRGLVTVREAVTDSMNIPAVKILTATGMERAVGVAKRLGLTLQDENLSAALGNTKNGVSFLELSGAYQTIANSGKYSEPKFIKSIRDRNGKTVYFDTGTKYNYAPQAVGSDTAYLITDMLKDVSKKGTGRKLSYLNVPIASKTGTSQRENSDTNTDAAFVSYTPENVLVAWVGNADMAAEHDLPKGTVGGGRLGFIVRRVHSVISKSGADFVRPNSVTDIKLDAADYRAGDLKRASANTPESETVSGLFSARYAPTEVSENFMTAIAPVIDGKIGDGQQPQIWFDALPHQTYEIYKNDILQEVVSNQSGQYTFTDKTNLGTNVYTVTASVGDLSADSNEITLRAAPTNEPKPLESKPLPWYF